MKFFQFAFFVAMAAAGVTQSSAAPLRGVFRFREALEEAPTGAAAGTTGTTGMTGFAVPPAPVVPKENPIIAAYKEKMELCKVQCNDAKSLTFNASEALNISIAVVQKFMSSAAEEVAEAKKSETEEGGATTLESLTNSQRHASDAKHERKRLKALRGVLKTSQLHEEKVCERYDTAVEEFESARQKVWKDKKAIYDEIKMLVKRTKRWLVREMAAAKQDAQNATAAQMDPTTQPLIVTHKILVLDRAIRASHATKLYFDAIVKRYNKAEAEANAEHEKLFNKPMAEVVEKRKQQVKSEEDDGPSWSNDYIESLGKNMTEAIGQAQESREIVANITEESSPAVIEDARASGTSEPVTEEMRFRAVPLPIDIGNATNTTEKNASLPTSLGESGASGAEDYGDPRAVTHSFTRDGQTVTTNTVFHGNLKQKKNALWEKIKEIEEKKNAGPSEEAKSGASGAAGAPSGPVGGKDKISRLASMENVIYGQVNAARRKEIDDEKIKIAMMKKINKLEAELNAARKPKDPVSAARRIHMIAAGNMEKTRSKTALSEEVREAADGALDPEDAVSLKAIALKLEGGASSSASGLGASGAGRGEEDASGISGPSDQEQLNGIVSKLNALPGQETKLIAKLASRLGNILASPSGSEDLGPAAQKGDRGGDKAMEKTDYKGLEDIAKKLSNLLGEGHESGSSGASGSGDSGASGSADEDDLDGEDSSGASGAEESADGVNAAEDEMLKKRVKVLEQQLEAIGGEDGSASMAAEDGFGSKEGEESGSVSDEESAVSSDESGVSGPSNGETAAPKIKPTQKGHEKDGFKKVDQVGRGDLDNMINHFFKKNADGEIDASGAGPLRGGSSQDVSPKIVPKLEGKGAPPAVQVVAKTQN